MRCGTFLWNIKKSDKTCRKSFHFLRFCSIILPWKRTTLHPLPPPIKPTSMLSSPLTSTFRIIRTGAPPVTKLTPPSRSSMTLTNHRTNHRNIHRRVRLNPPTSTLTAPYGGLTSNHYLTLCTNTPIPNTSNVHLHAGATGSVALRPPSACPKALRRQPPCVARSSVASWVGTAFLSCRSVASSVTVSSSGSAGTNSF